MYQELNDHKRSDKIKWIVVFTAIILLIAGVVAALVPIYTPKKDTEKQEVVPDMEVVAINDVRTLRLSSQRAVAVVAGNTHPQIVVTATVLPETAVDKTVTWSIEWENAQSVKASDYVSMEAVGNVATLTCLKAFNQVSNIILTCTSNDGGITANCVIKYVGRPTQISAKLSGSPAATVYYQEEEDGTRYLTQQQYSDMQQIAQVYGLGKDKDYYFDITYSNQFGVVGDEFKGLDVKVTFSGYDTFKAYKWSKANGFDKTKGQTFRASAIGGDLFKATVENGRVKVRVLDVIQNWTYVDDAAGITYKYYQDTPHEAVVFTMTITVSNGVNDIHTQEIYIYPYSSVNSVTLNAMEAKF